jgi:hypothetical protein
MPVFSFDAGNLRVSPAIAIKSPAMNFPSMGRKASRIVIRYGQYGRKASSIVKRYEKYGRNIS